MSEKEALPYKIRDRVTGDVIYAHANSRSQARTFAAHNRFDVSLLTVKEALTIKAEDVLDATGELGPDQVPLDLRPKQEPTP